MTFATEPVAPATPAGRAAALLDLATRVRNLAPEHQTAIYRVGQLAGPETWRGRVADVFWEEMFDEARRLGTMGDGLELVARRLEAQAAELLAVSSALSGGP